MFKGVTECVKLHKQGVPCDSGFEYVFNCEETEFKEFDISGDVTKQLAEIEEYSEYDVSNGRDIYAEFTRIICPAYKG